MRVEFQRHGQAFGCRIQVSTGHSQPVFTA